MRMYALPLYLVLVTVLLFGPVGAAAALEHEYVVGADIDYAPFSFLQDGAPSGFDIEFFSLLAETVDIDVIFHLDTWAELHKSAREGRVDVVLGALYTPEREAYLDFSEPYNTFRFSLIANEHSNIRSLAGLDGKQLAYLENDAVARILIDKLEIRPILVVFPRLGEAVQSVAAGDTDAAIAPSEWVAVNLDDARNDGIRVVDSEVFVSTYRIGITHGNPGLLDLVNDGIRRIVDSPEYHSLEAKWFGTRVGSEQAGSVTRSGIVGLVIGIIVLVIAIALVLFYLVRLRSSAS